MHEFKVAPLLRKNLLLLAKAYARHKGIKLGTVSFNAYRDRRFFDELAAKKIGFTAWRYDQLMAWFKAHWPADLPVPKGLWLPPK